MIGALGPAGRRRAAAWAAAAALAGGAAACGGDGRDDARPVVAVSLPPLAFFVERLAGDGVVVEVLLPAGADPHLFEPTPRQMVAVGRADLLVRVGDPRLPLETTWLDAVLADRPGLPVVDAMAVVGRPDDPHVWTSPRRAPALVDALSAALAELAPDDRAGLAARSAALREEIAGLDRRLAAAVDAAPGRRFWAFHPAWGVVAEDYGLVQVAVEQGHAEPTAERLARLVEDARAQGVEVVLATPGAARSSARSFAGMIGARVVEVDPLLRDWADGVGRLADALGEALR